ncbi:MAG: DJ-1/PfpI family protein [Candidatus Hydrogenedentes bacterium]|jgi:4-methyl-5(b-hydroxyethyl)-thiazole monophosphate biosynthesis|nr:DJ-1/PfpI family protein [Candidatus Hydrogenedentota bacterium]
MPRVLVTIADGNEELEAITIVDLLRRAEFDVTIAGLGEGPITASRGTVITPDKSLEQALEEDYDMVVLPGGLPGADNLNNDSRVQELLKTMANSGKFVGAICAAPYVLANAGVLSGKRATAYPGFLERMDLDDVEITDGVVERDGKVITSRGPGTAMDFALELIEALAGREKRDEVEEKLVRP